MIWLCSWLMIWLMRLVWWVVCRMGGFDVELVWLFVVEVIWLFYLLLRCVNESAYCGLVGFLLLYCFGCDCFVCVYVVFCGDCDVFVVVMYC